MTIVSPDLALSQEIPDSMTKFGEDKSPGIEWTGVPPRTESLVLICHNPDANDFSHWVVYNIPPALTTLTPDLPKVRELRTGAIQGMNGFRERGWGGPDISHGTHRYIFTLYAIDRTLEPDPRLENRIGILSLIREHVLAEASFERVYTK